MITANNLEIEVSKTAELFVDVGKHSPSLFSSLNRSAVLGCSQRSFWADLKKEAQTIRGIR